MKKYAVHTEEYAVINDIDHRFSMLLYYITIDKQIRQLERRGFMDVKAYDVDGKMVESDTKSHWIYYVASKP